MLAGARTLCRRIADNDDEDDDDVYYLCTRTRSMYVAPAVLASCSVHYTYGPPFPAVFSEGEAYTTTRRSPGAQAESKSKRERERILSLLLCVILPPSLRHDQTNHTSNVSRSRVRDITYTEILDGLIRHSIHEFPTSTKHRTISQQHNILVPLVHSVVAFVLRQL